MLKNGCLPILIRIPKMSAKFQQHGIALIQILLLTGILSVLALYMTQTASSQVAQAKLANDKAQALVSLHSAESLLLFELLTQTKRVGAVGQEEKENGINAKWNFYAKPFTINENVTVKIQDQAGLINLHYPNVELLTKLIGTKLLDKNKVNVVVDTILDWQDIDNTTRTNGAEQEQYGGISGIRNGSIPSILDINHIKSIQPEVQRLLINNGTIYTAGALSVFNTTKDLLGVLIDNSAVQQIMELRATDNITMDKFRQITGIEESDNIYYYTSNFLMIELRSNVGESVAQKSMVIFLQPYVEGDGRPYNLYKSW